MAGSEKEELTRREQSRRVAKKSFIFLVGIFMIRSAKISSLIKKCVPVKDDLEETEMKRIVRCECKDQLKWAFIAARRGGNQGD